MAQEILLRTLKNVDKLCWKNIRKVKKNKKIVYGIKSCNSSNKGV